MWLIKKVLLLSLLCITINANAQYLRADGKRMVDGNGKEIILRGMGLGGWMLQEPYMLRFGGIAANQKEIKKKIADLVGKQTTDQFYEAWLSNHCTKADVDSMAAWGFNSVRLPMHYNLYTLPVDEEKDPAQNTWLSKGFALTDSLLKWCAANKIYLILDLHAAPGGQGNDIPISDRDTSKGSLWSNVAYRNKTIALWKQLALRYKDEKWIGAYDLINEPNYGFQNPADKNGCSEKSNAELRALLVDITTAIRSVDNNHMIIIEGNCWGNNYNGMFPLWDKNMALSFHKYWNYNQPATIEQFLKMRDEQNVPLWCGESGENSNAWFTDAISLLEQHHIGWAWWPLKKLGANNPLEIKAPKGYDKLLKYFRGEEKTLSKDEAATILMNFAAAANISNNIVRKDVVDAMFRQVASAATLPYKPHLIKHNYILFASDFDYGRSGVAYHDKDSGNYWVSSTVRTTPNRGGQYRNDGVDIGNCSDSLTNGYFVGWTEAGEWLQYTINAASEGWYNVSLRTRSASDTISGTLQIAVNQKSIAQLTATGTQWSSTEAHKLWLKKGENRFTIFVINGGIDINYIRFQEISTDHSFIKPVN